VHHVTLHALDASETLRMLLNHRESKCVGMLSCSSVLKSSDLRTYFTAKLGLRVSLQAMATQAVVDAIREPPMKRLRTSVEACPPEQAFECQQRGHMHSHLLVWWLPPPALQVPGEEPSSMMNDASMQEYDKVD